MTVPAAGKTPAGRRMAALSRNGRPGLARAWEVDLLEP